MTESVFPVMYANVQESIRLLRVAANEVARESVRYQLNSLRSRYPEIDFVHGSGEDGCRYYNNEGIYLRRGVLAVPEFDKFSAEPEVKAIQRMAEEYRRDFDCEIGPVGRKV